MVDSFVLNVTPQSLVGSEPPLVTPKLTQYPPGQLLNVWNVAVSGAGGWTQTPPVQVPLTQSVPTEQELPSAQAAQPPPQSTSVSVPFCTPSLQVALLPPVGIHT